MTTLIGYTAVLVALVIWLCLLASRAEREEWLGVWISGVVCTVLAVLLYIIISSGGMSCMII